MIKKMKKAFTLIELLVVISIISLLATLVVAQFSTARVKSRDTFRISAIGQVQKALDIYYDTNNRYPDSSYNGCGGWEVSGTGGTAPPKFVTGLVNAGLLSAIKDPSPTLDNQNCGNFRYYRYTGFSGPAHCTAFYVLSAGLENAQAAQNSPGAFGDCWLSGWGGTQGGTSNFYWGYASTWVVSKGESGN